MSNLPKIFKGTERELRGWPTEVISGALLAIGLFLVVMAFLPGHPLTKTAVLAWVILP